MRRVSFGASRSRKSRSVLWLAGLLFTIVCGFPTASGAREQDWGKVVADAKKEGTVLVYTSQRPEARSATGKAFHDKYGITVDWVMGRQGELIARLKKEYSSGLKLLDLMLSSPENIVAELAPTGIFAPIAPFLTLPDVVDAKKWRNDKIPIFNGIAVKTTVVATEYRVVNKELVREGDITSTMDLLQPRWKGKIAIGDPSISGGANEWFTNEVFVLKRGLDLMRRLAKQDPVIVRDQRLMVEGLMHGKHSIMIGNSVSVPAGLIASGANIDFLKTKEPRVLSYAGNLVMLAKEASHPNAAKLFLNWLLSKEGSSIFAPASQYPSTRKDVSTEGFIPALVPRTGDIDPLEMDGYMEAKNRALKEAAEIFGLRK